MIAETVSTRARPVAAPRPTRKPLIDHDLPVLAATVAPPVCLDWASLMDRGVTPALPLGAERRLRGRR